MKRERRNPSQSSEQRRPGAPRYAVAVATAAMLLGVGVSCVPSIPPCECSGVGGAFPDEAQLDRSADCELGGDDCSYPGTQGSKYGYQEGDIFANFEGMNCDGEPAEFAEFLQIREDNGELNKGIIFSLGAEWCVPCREEAALFAAQAAERREDQIDFVHLLHEDQFSGPPTQDTCLAWFEAPEVANSAYPVLYDPTNSIDELMKGGESALPILLAVDANGHVRLREGGQAITESALTQVIDDLISDPYGN